MSQVSIEIMDEVAMMDREMADTIQTLVISLATAEDTILSGNDILPADAAFIIDLAKQSVAYLSFELPRLSLFVVYLRREINSETSTLGRAVTKSALQFVVPRLEDLYLLWDRIAAAWPSFEKPPQTGYGQYDAMLKRYHDIVIYSFGWAADDWWMELRQRYCENWGDACASLTAWKMAC